MFFFKTKIKMKINNRPFSNNTSRLIKDLVNQDVPLRLSPFYIFLKSLYYNDDYKTIISPSIDKLKIYDKLLSLNDFSSIEIEQACGSIDLSQFDYGMLIACYGEVDWANKPIYDRNVLLDSLEQSDFYNNAILDGSIEYVLKILRSQAKEEYRLIWYGSIMKAILAKKDWLQLVQPK